MISTQPDAEALRDWLRLLMTPGIGPVQARKLLMALGLPADVFRAGPSAWKAVLPRVDTTGLRTEPEGLDAQWQATLAWLTHRPPEGAEADGTRRCLTLADAAYPAALLEAPDPPLLLFAEGDLRLCQRPAVAVVGSRHATPQGEDNARAFARALSAAGVVVVSGLARGIDAAAHEGALQAAEAPGEAGHAGSTVAVLGTGLHSVYPTAHKPLAARVARRGLLLSEFLLDTPALPGNFPKRNRIVAALSRGTLVVEAAVRSGSLITARLAADMGREVLAIPGSIHAPQARGCHALIKQGAKLVESAEDVLEELKLDAALPATAFALDSGAKAGAAGAATGGHAADADLEADAPTEPVLRAMGHDPVSLDALVARTGWGPAELGARLLELELLGQVARLPGALFQRLARA